MRQALGDGGVGTATVRILLADPEWLFREAVERVLGMEPSFEVAARADSAAEAEMHAERLRPDVAFVSAVQPDGDGIDVTRAILGRAPSCRVALISDRESPDLLLRAVEAGACGYLTKAAELDELVAAARTMAAGHAAIPPHMVRPLLGTLVLRRLEFDQHRRRLARLTRREREVLALLARGVTSDVLAETLVISRATARTHVHNLLTKLEMHSRLEAASFVLQHDLLDELLEPGR